MVEMLPDQCNFVFSIPEDEIKELLNIFLKPPNTEDMLVTDLILTSKDIGDAINGVWPSAAVLPGQFPANLLKTYVHVLSLPLVIIWQDSLDKGIAPPPNIFKSANIVPIHEGDLKIVYNI